VAKKRKLISRNIRNIEEIIDCSVLSNDLDKSARKASESMLSDNLFQEKELVISLTTYSTKIHEVHLVIESIAQQTMKPNRIILWLDENEFSSESLPITITRQMKRGLEVKFCPNYYSYKKIVPTLQLVPSAYIITIDDDVMYGNNCIEILMNESKKNPNKIIGHRGHYIKFTGAGEVAPYRKWDYGTKRSLASHKVFLTGCGSILYPPNSLHKDVTDIETALELSPKADDVWLKVHALRNDTICKITDFSCKMTDLKRNRDIGLSHENVRGGGNDKQMKALLGHYQKTLQTLKNDNVCNLI